MPVGPDETDALAEALDEIADALIREREDVGARIAVRVDEVQSPLLRSGEDAVAASFEAAKLCIVSDSLATLSP